MKRIRKLCVLVILGMLLAVILFAAMPASAAQVNGFAPKRGKSGKVNIIGEGFSELRSDSVVVKFGSAVSPETEVKNDRIIKAEVPKLVEGIYPILLYGMRQDSGEWLEFFVGDFVVK